MSSDSVKNYVADKIKFYRKMAGLTQKELGEKIGVKHNTISSYESGKNEPEQDMLFKIAAALDISINELFPQTASSFSGIKGVRIPILGKVVAGIPIEAITDIDGWEEISPKMAASGEYFALRIKGLSMEPKLHEGDIVIVKRQSDVESGDTAIILVDSEDATVKQIKKTKEGIMLIGLNIDVYPPHFYTNREIADLPVQIIGKVVESRHTW
ncbi:LexA family protein [Acidaminococcus massiliensis]|uniref:LexA family protein n=1 Tax=Acidaminococcus massiliensis TaxID=1852375 RepID=UPI0035224055